MWPFNSRKDRISRAYAEKRLEIQCHRQHIRAAEREIVIRKEIIEKLVQERGELEKEYVAVQE